MLHCWKGNVEHAEELHGSGSEEWAAAFNDPSTCMLERDHDDSHEFTPDGNVVITFSPDDKER